MNQAEVNEYFRLRREERYNREGPRATHIAFHNFMHYILIYALKAMRLFETQGCCSCEQTQGQGETLNALRLLPCRRQGCRKLFRGYPQPLLSVMLRPRTILPFY